MNSANPTFTRCLNLPPSQVVAKAWAQEGYWILPDLLSAQECDAIKEEALRVLSAHARESASVYVGAAVVSPLFAALAAHPSVVAFLEMVMPNGVMFLSDKLVFKSADKRKASPWHLDAFYWQNTRPKISVWIPLDDSMADNGTLVVVPGSHRLTISEEANASGAKEFARVIRQRPWTPQEEVVCEVRRGSAIFFSDRLAHASCENTAGQDRYTIISTYHAPGADEAFDLKFPARRVLV